MKLKLSRGTTSKIVRLFIQDATLTNGGGLTGLTSSSSMSVYYIREGDSSATQITLFTGTVGTWSSGGFVEVDSTHMPGIYELGLPNAAISSGQSVTIMVTGNSSNIIPLPMELEVDSVGYQDSVAFGLSRLDSTISSRSTYAGGAVASVTGAVGSVTGAVTVGTNNDKTGYAVTSGTVTTVSSPVTVGTNNDKTGYTLTTGQFQVKKNQAFNNFTFPMFSTVTNQMQTGATVTAVRTIDNGAVASCANSVTELSNGFYAINFAASDLNGNCISVKFSATGCSDLPITFITQA